MDGRTLAGRYRLAETMAVADAYELWRGTDERAGAPVSVKLAKPDRRHGDLLGTWSAEAAAERDFGDRRLLRTLETGSEAGLCWMVREFAEGRTLEEILAEGPAAPDSAERVAVELCRLLSGARAARIAHRALLPRHVIVDPRGEVHVIGFVTGGYGRPAATVSRRFLAPEQRTETARSEREDVYNLGAILLEACTGTVGAADSNDEQGPAGASDGVARLLAVARRACAPDPRDRYPTLADMLDALRAGREAEQARRHLRPLAGLIAVWIALAVLAASFAGTRVTVPSVVGMPEERAAAALHRTGLSPEPSPRAHDDLARVVAQSPPPGRRVAPRTGVRLHLSPRPR